MLFAAWALHDVEEALAFPATCDVLAEDTGIEEFRIDQRESWVAVGLAGAVLLLACQRGVVTQGRSAFYRAVVAGLEAHVVTHLAASVIRRGYTAGVATAVPVMLPGAVFARQELRRTGMSLTTRDYLNGAAILIPVALLCQVIARMVPSQQQ
ncbi:HXXEE domain-containing protein [Raineyella sp. LH-20]|uniref:HXXEE domain-containing protein n=1 Tax=Raineyella sp. LH-20 TaxID=3081204 RepID=UPI0029536AD7|nr:HXXEE domain-containing protein [Raineyella sp. LH-20]WOP19090.1 HXXEE domain-containing protein [Raineyella sp. LH-20]